MKLPVLIGLCGAAGAGKDTVGAILAERGFERLSFAAPLKEVCRHVFGLEARHVNGTQADKAEPLAHVTAPDGTPRTPRHIMEYLGTEGFRSVDPDVWVKLCLRSAQRVIADGGRVVVTDVRFQNEGRAIREAGGIVWRVERIGAQLPGAESTHASALDWQAIEPDFTVSAKAGDLEGLRHETLRGLCRYHDQLVGLER